MPDRHGPMKVVYEEAQNTEGFGGQMWGNEDTGFEGNTPNDVLDRITRGILQTDPQWLADELTGPEITAVEESFGVTIGGGDGGGEVELPIDRFAWEEFNPFFGPGEDEGTVFVSFEATVTDADGDTDLTKIKISADSDDGQEGSVERAAEGETASELQFFEAPLFDGAVEPPITATLSAADSDSGEAFVDLVTEEFSLGDDTTPPR